MPAYGRWDLIWRLKRVHSWKSIKNDDITRIYMFWRTAQTTFDPRCVVTTAGLVIKR